MRVLEKQVYCGVSTITRLMRVRRLLLVSTLKYGPTSRVNRNVSLSCKCGTLAAKNGSQPLSKATLGVFFR